MKYFVAAALALIALGIAIGLLRRDPQPIPNAINSKQIKTEPKEAKLRDTSKVITIPATQAEAAFDLLKLPAGALAGEVTLTYPDTASAEVAMQRLRDAGYRILGYNRALNTLRVAVGNAADRQRLARLAGPDAQAGFTFPVTSPPTPEASKSGGGTLPFGSDAIAWMGGGNSTTLGEGVTVAVIDSGIAAHPNLEGVVIGEIVIGESSGVSSGHGTSVASLIAGQTELAPGIAPGTDILSVNVLDSEGASDTFAVAEAIVAATDAGARIINLSLGTYGDSTVLLAAVEYAQSQGAILVASVGNDATSQVVYPAAYDGVVGVASVDASGQSATFSNYGTEVDVSAPGVAVNAASIDTTTNTATLVEFSGTSASAPLVSGALAALLSENPTMSNQQAVEILTSTANDSGAPGTDDYVGSGSVNLERMLRYDETGVSDVAIADHYLAGGDSQAVSVLVTVQNRGTTWESNLQLEVSYEGRTQSYTLTGLNPGETGYQEILLNPSLLTNGGSTVITSSVRGSSEDANPDDNTRATQVTLQPQTQ